MGSFLWSCEPGCRSSDTLGAAILRVYSTHSRHDIRGREWARYLTPAGICELPSPALLPTPSPPVSFCFYCTPVDDFVPPLYWVCKLVIPRLDHHLGSSYHGLNLYPTMTMRRMRGPMLLF